MAHYLHDVAQKNCESKISKEMEVYESAIDTIRKQGLAHNDKDKSQAYVDLKVLFQILDEIRMLFASMYDRSIDTGVLRMDDNHLRALKRYCTEGLHLMLYRDEHPVVFRS